MNDDPQTIASSAAVTPASASAALSSGVSNEVLWDALREMHAQLQGISARQQQNEYERESQARRAAVQQAHHGASSVDLGGNPSSSASAALPGGLGLPHPNPNIRLAKPGFFLGLPSSNVTTWLFEMEQYLDASRVLTDAQRVITAATYLRDLASHR